MSRAKKSKDDSVSAIILKNHFVSKRFFREEPLINWTFTKAVLFSAYDVHRSSDFWVDTVIKSGLTLKEALIELGFPKENTMMVDTGIFEIEARKAEISRELGIEVELEFSNDQIFEVFRLSGADLLVSPDEVNLASDTNKIANKKLGKIKDNMLEALEWFPADKIVGVLQGVKQSRIEDLFDFYPSQGVNMFAIGGVIHLYRHDKSLFKEVLRKTSELTKDYWLHTFGLPRLGLLPYYLQDIGMDSLDTSMLLYLTARRRYLVDVASRPVRLADFDDCDCPGCKNLTNYTYSMSSDFFINLYIHILLEASHIAELCLKGAWSPRSPREQKQEHLVRKSAPRESIERYELIADYDRQWITSDILLDDLKKTGRMGDSDNDDVGMI